MFALLSFYHVDNCGINPDECISMGVDDQGYVERVNHELLKLAVRGVTLLASTGLSGTHTRTDPYCAAKSFRADFPASSPWVVAVGGTQWINQTDDALEDDQIPPICTNTTKSRRRDATDGTNTLICMQGDRTHGSEQAPSLDVAGFSNGGGFSNVAPMLPFQRATVWAYLNQTRVPVPPTDYYNVSNRAFPDVSAIAHNCLLFTQNEVFPACAAPIWAGILSLLNQVAMRRSGKPLGYVNPLLYQMKREAPDTFYDVVVGDNHCTEETCDEEMCLGFACTTGWTPVTGLGTPNVQAMLDYLENIVFPLKP